MPHPLSRMLADALPVIVGALPRTAPGLCTREIHGRIGDDVGYVTTSIKRALEQLQRDGLVVSEIGIGSRGRETRFYRRAEARP